MAHPPLVWSVRARFRPMQCSLQVGGCAQNRGSLSHDLRYDRDGRRCAGIGSSRRSSFARRHRGELLNEIMIQKKAPILRSTRVTLETEQMSIQPWPAPQPASLLPRRVPSVSVHPPFLGFHMLSSIFLKILDGALAWFDISSSAIVWGFANSLGLKGDLSGCR